ncbi:MAG: metallophosphoesterase family protein [Dehalococcoidia bacterium]
MTYEHVHDDPAMHLPADSETDAGDGVDRRGFLKCMAWAGTGLVWTLAAGVLSSATLVDAATAATDAAAKSDFTFVQLSDSHIGFSKDPNKDVTATLKQAVDRVNALKAQPDFILHTGDISHLSTPAQFDMAQGVLQGAKARDVFFIPGEHDTFNDNGAEFLKRYRKPGESNAWQSFDHKGVHFVALINVWNVKAGGFGTLGAEQIAWLKQDLQGLSANTPVVVYAHVPLWSVYPRWGWGTDDAEQALTLLRRFASVTVLNGHIHQILQKVDGNITFHTAASTAYPQPAPGLASGPGPLRVVTDQLLSSLGVREVSYQQKKSRLVLIDRRVG